MRDDLAIEKVRWKPVVGSMLTAGSNRTVTTDSQGKRTAEMLRSYNVTFCGDLVFGRMFFKTEKKKAESEKKLSFNGVLYLCQRPNVPLCTAKLRGLEGHRAMRKCCGFHLFLKSCYVPAAASIKTSCFIRLQRQ